MTPVKEISRHEWVEGEQKTTHTCIKNKGHLVSNSLANKPPTIYYVYTGRPGDLINTDRHVKKEC